MLSKLRYQGMFLLHHSYFNVHPLPLPDVLPSPRRPLRGCGVCPHGSRLVSAFGQIVPQNCPFLNPTLNPYPLPPRMDYPSYSIRFHSSILTSPYIY